MRVLRIALRALAGLLVWASAAQAAQSAAEQLERVIAGAHRTPAFAARDPYRHPKATLLFFGLQPEMHVVEISPGAGWYTEILAPLLRERGRYYAAHPHIDPASGDTAAKGLEVFRAKMAEHPALYDRVVVTGLRIPDHTAIAPRGSADMVLTFRNVHNWMQAGTDQAMFRAFFDALKPGGVLGVVEHRARPGTPIERMKRTGYVTESHVSALALGAGFRPAGRSEVNANPKDTTDHPEGVWTLPPTLRLGQAGRAKYLAIGESDRMTLRFVKP